MEHNTEDFDVGLANEYILDLKKRYENGELSYSRFAHLRKLAFWLIEVYKTGELPQRTLKKSRITINFYFEDMLNRYIYPINERLSPASIVSAKSEGKHRQYFFDIRLIRLFVIEQYGKCYVLLYIEFWNKIERLKDKADIAAAKDSQLFVVHEEYLVIKQQIAFLSPVTDTTLKSKIFGRRAGGLHLLNFRRIGKNDTE